MNSITSAKLSLMIGRSAWSRLGQGKVMVDRLLATRLLVTKLLMILGRLLMRSLHATPRQLDKRVQLGNKILSMVPRFLKPYTVNFIKKPVSNLVSFIILHELTAVVPLVGLWYLFYKYQISVPLDLPQWAINKGTKIIDDSLQSLDLTTFTLNDKFTLIMQGAYAFVIVKMLFPLRVMFSFAFTPWFTRWFVDPITRLFTRTKTTSPPGSGNKLDNRPVAINPTKPKQVGKPRL